MAVACVPSELDIFSRSRIQNAILGNQIVGLKPMTATSLPLSTLEFVSSGSSEFYRDLSHTYLRLKVSIRDQNGGAPAPENSSGVINNLLFSLFQTMEVYMNERCICRIDHFGYKEYIETLLNYSAESAKTHLTSSMFYLDTPTKFEVAGDENLGYKKRKDLLLNSKVCELYGRLRCGIFDQNLLIPSGIDLRIKLTFAPENFYMWVTEGENPSKLHILDSTLYVKQVMINPGVLMAHAKILAQNNAIFPHKRVEIKTFTVSPGGRTISINSVCTGKIPSFISFCITPNGNFNGDASLNPFSFVHKSITNVSIFTNSEEFRIGPMDFHSTQPFFSYAYHTLFSSLGVDTKNSSHMITPEMFAHGTFIVCKDLTPDSSGNVAHTSLVNNGVLRIEATFANEIDAALTCIILMEFDATMEIDQNRNVIVS